MIAVKYFFEFSDKKSKAQRRIAGLIL